MKCQTFNLELSGGPIKPQTEKVNEIKARIQTGTGLATRIPSVWLTRVLAVGIFCLGVFIVFYTLNKNLRGYFTGFVG